MGNHHSVNLNEIQALLNPVARRAESEENQHLNFEGVLNRISDIIGTSTTKSNSTRPDDIKLKSISDVINLDDVQSFTKILHDQNRDVAGSLPPLLLTPLHLAAYHNSFKILRHLLKQFQVQVQVNTTSIEGDTALNLGLISAESDAVAVQLLRTFLTRKDLDTLAKNEENIFPLLITTAKKFTSASKILLTSPHKKIIDEYEAQDLVQVMKVALSTHQDSLIDVINLNLSSSRRQEVISEFRSNDAGETLTDLANILERTTLAEIVQNTLSESNNTNVIQKEYSNLDKTLSDESDGIYSTGSGRRSDAPEPDSFTSIDDAGGVELKVGNVVRTLSVYNIKKGLPLNAKESDVMRLAEKRATIHEITGRDKIYVEIHGEQCVARIKADATIFLEEGSSKTIGDGSSGRIGSFVQVLSREKELRKFAGKHGWVHGMEDACGRTGRIVRILPNSDVLVQFAYGPRFYFKPDGLLQSSSDRTETQDYKNNWIKVGSLVQVKKPRAEFLEIQKKNNLPIEGSYTDLPWKFAVVKAIRIKAFSSSKTVKIIYKGSPYFVHVECIELIESVKDQGGTELRVGSRVKVVDDEDQLKTAQEGQREFGGWNEDMVKTLDEVGKVTHLCVDERGGELNAVMVKVAFEDSSSFYFNPRALQTYTGTVVTKLRPTLGGGGGGGAKAGKQGGAEDDTWEKIERSNLECFEILGEGGFGCVVRGEWSKNGTKKVVAIKKVKVGVTSGAGPLDGVMKEAQIQFSMRHPNIVSLFGISLEKDLWIVMDLVDGEDLYTMLFPNDRTKAVELSTQQKLKFCTDMSNAIAYIHQKRYLHCDIKPHNMMVDRKSGHVYVCDFGITKFLGNMDLMEFATQYTNSVSGTLYYISPECLQPDVHSGKYRKQTFASDIWALGAVFYELFTTEHLYDHHMKFLQDKLSNKDSVVKEKMAGLPNSVRSIVSKSLNFAHASRPTAQQLAEFFHELH